MSSGKQWFTAKYRHQKPGQQSSTAGSKQFFVYSHQEAIDQCRNELEAKYPGYIITVSRG